MAKLQVKIYDCATGETIIRDESDAEESARIEQLKIDNKNKLKAQADAKAKAALLDKLGITEEEAALLLS